MKLVITVDSKDSPVLLSKDVEIYVDDKKIGWISNISFAASLNQALVDFKMEQAEKDRSLGEEVDAFVAKTKKETVKIVQDLKGKLDQFEIYLKK